MKTKWKTLAFYTHCGTAHCVQARINKKTGAAQFRTKIVCGLFGFFGGQLPMLDVTKQWNELVGEST